MSGAPHRILHFLPDFVVGGGQRVVLQTIRRSDPARFAHTVCWIRRRGDMAPQFAKAGARLLCLEHQGMGGFPARLARLVRFVRDEGIDAIHTNNTQLERLYGHLAALATGRPVAETIHWPTRDLPSDPRGRWIERARRGIRWFEGRTLSRWTVRDLVVVSRAVRESRAWYVEAVGLPDEHVHIVYPGTALESFSSPLDPARAARLRQELGVAEATPLLINIGRLVEGKGQRFLVPLMIEVARRHPQARLVVIGEGPERERLERAIADAGLGDRVLLVGHRHDVPDLLRLADLIVLPSLEEAFGMAFLEAIATGAPVVGFKIKAVEEFFRDGLHGRLVPVGDVATLIAAVMEILDRPRSEEPFDKRRERLEFLRPFEAETSVASLERIYENLAGERASRKERGAAVTPACGHGRRSRGNW